MGWSEDSWSVHAPVVQVAQSPPAQVELRQAQAPTKETLKKVVAQSQNKLR